jgi:hypothetical protein
MAYLYSLKCGVKTKSFKVPLFMNVVLYARVVKLSKAEQQIKVLVLV